MLSTIMASLEMNLREAYSKRISKREFLKRIEKKGCGYNKTYLRKVYNNFKKGLDIWD